MADNQASTLLIYFLGAVVLCGISVVAIGVLVDVNRHFNRWLLPFVNPLVLAAIVIGAVLSKRDITNAEFEIGTAAGTEPELLIWLMRLVSMTVLGICIARLISASVSYESRPRYGRGLFMSFLLFYITNAVLNNIFGAKPVFDQKLIYPALAFLAAYLNRNKDFAYMIVATKWGLLLFSVASCAAVVLFPQAALQQAYASPLPAIHVRLWGLGSNPNSIGPLALVLLLLQAHQPFRSRILQLIGYGAGFFVLVLSQSKTAWLAALIAFPTLWWGNALYAAAVRARSRVSVYPIHGFSRPIFVCLLGLICISAVAYIYLHTSLTALAGDEQVTSLTGRTDIWAVAIDIWKKNPLFGYGSTIWDQDFRRLIGMDFAYHAHNQFLQSLSAAGAVGFAGLLVYTLALFRYAYAANTATRGLSLALFWVVFIRFFTETPLNMSSLFTGEFATHLLLFSIVLAKGRRPYPAMQTTPAEYERLRSALPR